MDRSRFTFTSPGPHEGLQPPNTCYRENTAEHKESKRFLECTDGNFFLQVKEEPRRRGNELDLILTNKEGLVGNVNPKGRLGCSDRETVEFEILREKRRADRELTALDFNRDGFGLLKDLLDRVPLGLSLGGKRIPRELNDI